MIASEISKAQQLINSGKLEEALAQCRELSRAHPSEPNVWVLLATVLKQLGELSEATDCCTKLTELTPESAAAHYNLAIANRQAGDLEGAEDSIRRAITLDPADSEIRLELGSILQQQGKMEAAENIYLEVLKTRPDFADAHHGLTRLYISQGRLDSAKKQIDEAKNQDPSSPWLYMLTGSILQEQCQQDKALSFYQKAIELQPDNAEFYLRAGNALLNCGELEAAESHFRKALQLDANSSSARIYLAEILEKQGDYKRCLQVLEPYITGDAADLSILLLFSKLCNRADRCSEAIELLTNYLNKANLSNPHRRSIHFSLGRLFDQSGDATTAFEHYKKGNKLKAASFNEWELARDTDRIIKTFNREALQSLPRARAQKKSLRSIFIVGMPRSGSSLTEQILASHPDVHGAGELSYLGDIVDSMQKLLDINEPYPECMPGLSQQDLNTLSKKYLAQVNELKEPGKKYLTDKMPGNFAFLGLMELILPKARIVHCKRDPLDTCLSCYFQDFSARHDYAYDLSKLGAFYHQYERLMGHWGSVLTMPVLEINYEDMVTDPEGSVRTLLEFCGLKWNDKCLGFHKSTRTIHTASYNQVRNPFYKSSVGRWKAYSEFLEPLQKALARQL